MKDQKYGSVTLEKKPDAPADEPVFVLRGQDCLAPAAVFAYADMIEACIPGLKGKNDAERIRDQARETAAWKTRKLPD